MKAIETRTASIHIDENNIIHIVIKKDICIDYEDAIDNVLVIKNLTKNNPCLKLIDMRNNCSVEKKASDFVNTQEIKQKTIGRAIIKGFAFNKLLINFLIKLNKPETPTRMFTDYDEAYKWLLSLK